MSTLAQKIAAHSQGASPAVRLKGFVMFCQGFAQTDIADLLCVSHPTIVRWKKLDEWEQCKTELEASTRIEPLPTWVPFILAQLRCTRQEVRQLRKRFDPTAADLPDEPAEEQP